MIDKIHTNGAVKVIDMQLVRLYTQLVSTAAKTMNPLQATHKQAINTSLAFIIWALLMVLIGKSHHTSTERIIAWLMILSPSIILFTTQLYLS